MRDYRKYRVWEKGHEFAIQVYQVTKQYPKDELYGLTSQLRRAALSIPTNIAEGSARNSEKEFAQFLNISSGSASECEYLLEFSNAMNYLNEENHKKLNLKIIEIRKMLNSLYTKVKYTK